MGMRKWIGMIIGVILIIFVSLYWLNGQAFTELADNKTMAVQEGDFILHIRAEGVEGGFQVFKAIQYVGDESIEIKHQTPLVSVSVNHPNHDYTGSEITNMLNTGNSYHPQKSKTFKIPEDGTYTLFCEARFAADGEQMTITHQAELIFQ